MVLKFYFKLFFFLLFFILCSSSEIGDSGLNDSDSIYYLEIPVISLNGILCYGSRESCLQGNFVWVKFGDENGNTLLTAHSFSLLPLQAGPFYGLGDVERGDHIVLNLEERETYEVYAIYVTDRYDLSVEDFSSLRNTLVLYSCFPVWSASKRIVVKARLCDFSENEI